MGLYDAVKDAAKILKEAGKINEYQKILDLIDDLSNKKDEIEKLKDEIKKLKTEVLKLQNQLKITDEYIFKNNCYWHKKNDDGPYCSHCFDKNKELIRILPDYLGSNDATCPECKTQVNFTGKKNQMPTNDEPENFDPY